MRLKDNERAMIARRRLGLSQTSMAKRLGVSTRQYVLFEAGVAPGKLEGVEPIGRLLPHERCVIMRRHCGKTQAEVAREMKCSRRWVTLMELGRAPCNDLIEYWEC